MLIKVKLKELREELNLSQAQLAYELKISQSAIAKWELGKTEPTAAYIKKIANYFNASADYLLGLENDYGIKTRNAKLPPGAELAEGERLWLEFYRRLPPKGIQMICNMIKPVMPDEAPALDKIIKTV